MENQTLNGCFEAILQPAGFFFSLIHLHHTRDGQNGVSSKYEPLFCQINARGTRGSGGGIYTLLTPVYVFV